MEVTQMIDAREGVRLPEGAVQQAYLSPQKMEESTLNRCSHLDAEIENHQRMGTIDISRSPNIKSAAALICSFTPSNFDVKNEERIQANALFHSTSPKEGPKKWQNDYVWIANSMDPELYRYATTGNTVAFQDASADTERSPLEQLSPRQNTVLHLAARSSHHQLANFILQRFPELVMRKNYKGDLALHVAARGGHLSVVEMLVLSSQKLVASSSGNIKSLLNEVNNQGNTALHAALENHQEEVANFLVMYTDSTLSYHPNKKNKSPLCMATEAGYLELVRKMIDNKSTGSPNRNVENMSDSEEESVDNFLSCTSNTPYESLEGKSLLHVAIKGRNIDVLKTIYQKNPTLIKSIDEKGRTPLSLAAYIGYLDGARYLLEKSTDETYQMGSYGFFPIHVASMMGHIKIVQQFLQHRPDSRELLDEQGQNILHAATKCGKAKLVSYMLKTRDLEMLINERDLEGNTPLHLATLNWHPKVVSILTWDKRVNLKLVNNNGQTAIDVAEKYIGTKPPFRMRLTLMALKSAKAPRAERDIIFRENSESSNASRAERDSIFRENSKSFPSWKPPNKDQYNERVNTLLLVATLVATMTFAAGFTMPGGFNSSGSQGEGMVTLVMKSRFHVFLICNTIAMYSSVTAVVILIWAQLGDLNLIIAAFKLALPLLAVALTMMSLAFMTGVYLVVGNLSWLANVVLIMGSIFVITISAFFLPLHYQLSSSNVILRYIFYYPFCLIIWVTKSNIDGRKE